MSLLAKFQSLINLWFPNKSDDETNYNSWINKMGSYKNGALNTNGLWKHSFGKDGGRAGYSYSEVDGYGTGKGFILNNGFPNTPRWKLKFEFRHDNIRYTGICFLVDMSGTYNGVSGTGNKISTWEGSWLGGTAYASYSSGTIDWFDVTVTKIDDTHVRLQSTTLNRDTTIEVSWLPSASVLSCGAVHNSSGNSYGPCRIRNVEAVNL